MTMTRLTNPARMAIAAALFAASLSGCVSRPPAHYVVRPGYAVSDPQFARSMGNLLGPVLIDGNNIQSFSNGEQIFPPMLAEIRGAQRSVTFETYIYWSGVVGKLFTDALAERARAGVSVHVILDWVGAGKIDPQYLDQMRDAGVHVVQFHKLHWYDLNSVNRLNNRTHRKLLVIDGKVGFTGGVGIADCWNGHGESPDHWRDMHYRIEGPVVAQLQSAFLDNWMKTTEHVIDGEEYFPPLTPVGSQKAQVFKSSIRGGSESVELMYLLSIAAARKTVRIGIAYFVPDDLVIQSLVDATHRGVSVEIIVPGYNTDEKIVRRASRSRWGELLKHGVKIYEYQPTMYHTKLLIVDDLWVSIGSSNLDDRSFRLNDEANLNVLDPRFAAEQTRIFNEDLLRAKPITYDAWLHRPAIEQLLEGAASLLSPLL